nr:hypothetical protein [Pandoravirus massiliensis]
MDVNKRQKKMRFGCGGSAGFWLVRVFFYSFFFSSISGRGRHSGAPRRGREREKKGEWEKSRPREKKNDKKRRSDVCAVPGTRSGCRIGPLVWTGRPTPKWPLENLARETLQAAGAGRLRVSLVCFFVCVCRRGAGLQNIATEQSRAP